MRANPRLIATALAALSNAIVLFNAVCHEPAVQYDIREHLNYMQILSTGRLPQRDESGVFYSAPGPYAVPAALLAADVPPANALKVAQLANVLFSILTFVLTLRICRMLGASWQFRAAASGLLGLLPVYYLMHSQGRGEPMVTTLAVGIAYLLCLNFLGRFRWRDMLLLGVLFGLIILARQWGFFLYPATIGFLLLVLASGRFSFAQLFRAGAAMWGLAFLIGGWFYVFLIARYGTPAPFYHSPSKRPLLVRLRENLLSLDLGELFSRQRPYAFRDHFLPTFYTSVWGDHWGYFNITNGQQNSQRRLYGGVPFAFPRFTPEMMSYYGRVNLVSVLPTLLYLAGLCSGAGNIVRAALATPCQGDAEQRRRLALAFFGLIALLSVGLFALFGLRYEMGGTHLKAGYMLHIYPFLALLGADVLEKLRRRLPWGHRLTVGTLIGVFVHNFPMLLTRYRTPWPFGR